MNCIKRLGIHCRSIIKIDISVNRRKISKDFFTILKNHGTLLKM